MNIDGNTPRISVLAGALAGALFLASSTSAAPMSSAAANASDATSRARMQQGEDRLRTELRELVASMIEAGEFGDVPSDQISLTVSTPSQRISNLGVLVDSANTSQLPHGLKVLAVTPGSAGERIGLRTGDTLLSVNDVSLRDLGSDDAGARAVGVLRDQVGNLRTGESARLAVRRGEQNLQLSGPVPSVQLPAMRLSIGMGEMTADAGSASANSQADCGRISVFDVAPRQQQLHAAGLLNIDGHLAGTTGQTVFRVAAGEHVLEVSERIDNRYLLINDRQRNAGPQYKSLTINVEPNTTYFVAARLNQDKATQAKDGAFWDPVVWKQVTESCR